MNLLYSYKKKEIQCKVEKLVKEVKKSVSLALAISKKDFPSHYALTLDKFVKTNEVSFSTILLHLTASVYKQSKWQATVSKWSWEPSFRTILGKK